MQPSDVNLTTTAQVRPSVGRLHEIDLLRIIAAMAVVLYHYLFSAYAGDHSEIEFPTGGLIARYGYLGVDLFFMISGFVVLLSAWNRKPKAFVISRVVRLYPAYWIAVTLTAIVSVLFSQGRFPVGAVQYVANLTMFNSLPNIENVDVVYWTLWAELRFYMIIFVLTLIGITKTRVTIALWAWLGLTFVYQTGVLPSAADLVLNTQFSHYFIAGMALCMIYRFGMSLQAGAIILICLGNAVYRAMEFSDAVQNRYSTEIHNGVVVPIIVLIFVVLTLVALKLTNRFARPWFVVLGALTYPLYLIHAHIGFIIFERLGTQLNRYLLVTLTVFVMLAAAYAINRFVENPLAPRIKKALDRLTFSRTADPQHRA